MTMQVVLNSKPVQTAFASTSNVGVMNNAPMAFVLITCALGVALSMTVQTRIVAARHVNALRMPVSVVMPMISAVMDFA